MFSSSSLHIPQYTFCHLHCHSDNDNDYSHHLCPLIVQVPLAIGVDCSTGDADDDEKQIEYLPDFIYRCRTFRFRVHFYSVFFTLTSYFSTPSMRLKSASLASMVLVRNFCEPPFWKPSPFLFMAIASDIMSSAGNCPPPRSSS